eukprot:scaffold127711_cov22-Prasinocladus_malaysianus.AAC.2
MISVILGLGWATHLHLSNEATTMACYHAALSNSDCAVRVETLGCDQWQGIVSPSWLGRPNVHKEIIRTLLLQDRGG